MPARKYRLFGPLEIPRGDDLKDVERKALKGFWEAAEDLRAGLAAASGCYIFAIRAGLGTRPWYVGQAKKGFQQECFTDPKLLRYNGVIGRKKGTPLLFLVARMTPTGRLANGLDEKEVTWVENQLISHCLVANKELLNVSGVAFPTEVVIPGLLNTSRGSRREGQWICGICSTLDEAANGEDFTLAGAQIAVCRALLAEVVDRVGQAVEEERGGGRR